ncbi:hypothetical protein AQ794_05280 [Burkholderia pseudomallei]|nr:hypothetical protein AQ791_11880 [Burkholderia pseudomallei]OMV46149.1 hypothetical protein AQ792_25965 [Burkholderia pseudomallei]OMV46297.1 hypothetical protein AQ793_22500 [Burkholderia pseudomallei]OMV56331.1 hypothetical protein AQ794_05280 [Burkholderia pseudomallei]OMV68126.1 hypothetical protein AQ796_12985 [Burkholderia pseudomallei]
MRTRAPAHWGARRRPRRPRAERRAPNAARRTPRAERRAPNAARRTPNAERPQSPYAACVIAQVRR